MGRAGSCPLDGPRDCPVPESGCAFRRLGGDEHPLLARRSSPGVCRPGKLDVDVKRLLVVALVVVVLLTGSPLAMGMPGTDCVHCGLGLLVAGVCVFAVLTGMVAVALTLLGVQLRIRPAICSGLLATSGLDRPPRLA